MPTRDEIKKAMKDTGGSYVLLTPKGTLHIRTEEDIPPDEELAMGNPEEEARTLEEMQRQVRDLQARMQTLRPSTTPVPVASAPTVDPNLGLKQGTEGIEGTAEVPKVGGTTSDATESRRPRRG